MFFCCPIMTKMIMKSNMLKESNLIKYSKMCYDMDRNCEIDDHNKYNDEVENVHKDEDDN